MAVLWPFPAISGKLYNYLSQNWDWYGHFELISRSKPWLVQNLWLKMQIFPLLFFCDIVKTFAIFAFFAFFGFLVLFSFCVIPVVPIIIQTCSAPQNDRLKLSFVKEFHIVGKKMARTHHSKMPKDGWAKYIPNFAFKWC